MERRLAEATIGSMEGDDVEETDSRVTTSTGDDDDEPYHLWGAPNRDQAQRRRPVADPPYHQILGMKVEIPEFDGKSHPDDFIDWLHTMERVFDVKPLPDEQNVKLVALKLRKHASIWWEHVKNRRARKGKPKIHSWEC